MNAPPNDAMRFGGQHIALLTPVYNHFLPSSNGYNYHGKIYRKTPTIILWPLNSLPTSDTVMVLNFTISHYTCVNIIKECKALSPLNFWKKHQSRNQQFYKRITATFL